jgi:hypothetical protein
MNLNFKIALVSFFILITSCSQTADNGSSSGNMRNALAYDYTQAFRPMQIGSVAVLPLKGGDFSNLENATLNQLTTKLSGALGSLTTMEVIASNSADSNLSNLASNSARENTLQQRAYRYGLEKKSKGVIYGIVNKFPSVEEYEYLGSGRDAVRFSLWLLDVQTNQVVWNATYENSNKPLTDNLFTVKQKLNDGLRYQTPSEMIEQGFKEAARSLEKLRNQALIK